MSDITISYKGNSIATMDATGTKTLLTEGKYCEDDIEVAYVKPSGGGDDDDPVLKDVVFVDYDGTVVYNYTKAEFLALDSMPSNPSHSGLISQGWNATLQEAQTYVQANDTLCIGQNYTTSDGETKVYITVTDYTINFDYQIRIITSVKNGVTIYWGDGTSVVTSGNAGASSIETHKYSTTGDYVISIKCTEGSYSLGAQNANAGIFVNNNNVQTRATALTIKKIHIGNGVTQVNRNVFTRAKNMEEISIPTTLVTFGENASSATSFHECFSLKCVVFPKNSTLYSTAISDLKNAKFISFAPSMSIDDSALSSGQNQYLKLRMFTVPSISSYSNILLYADPRIEKIAIPGTYSTLNGSTCREIFLTKKFIVNSSVTTIADYALAGSIFEELVMLPTTPPTIANTRGMPVFISGFSKIIVPYSADHSVLTAYQTATSWSAYADYMEEASAS